MEPRFKTSFIPKQSLPQEAAKMPQGRRVKKSLGVFPLVCGVIFIVALVASGFVLLRQNMMIGEIEAQADALEAVRDGLDENIRLIEKLERYALRVESAETVLGNHIAPTALFSLLSATILKNARYDRLEMNMEENGVVTLLLQGEATDLEAVALQSDIYGKMGLFQDAKVSELQEEVINLEANETEIVGTFDGGRTAVFSVESQVDRDFLKYRIRIDDESVDALLQQLSGEAYDSQGEAEIEPETTGSVRRTTGGPTENTPTTPEILSDGDEAVPAEVQNLVDEANQQGGVQ